MQSIKPGKHLVRRVSMRLYNANILIATPSFFFIFFNKAMSILLVLPWEPLDKHVFQYTPCSNNIAIAKSFEVK